MSIEVENIGESPYGQVKSGKTVLRGLCRAMASLNKEHEFFLKNGSVWSWCDRDGTAGVGAPHPSAIRFSMHNTDVLDESFFDRTDIIFSKIACFESLPDNEGQDDSFDRPRPATASYSLVLEQTGLPEGTYQRIWRCKIPWSASRQLVGDENYRHHLIRFKLSVTGA